MSRQEPEIKKTFGLWSATFLVVANMIGAGVFTTSGYSFNDLGDRQFVMWAWLIGAVIAVCGAISYGQLAKRMTESGGEYLFLHRFVHPAVGFVAGWVSLLAGFTGAIAFAAVALEKYAVPESVRPEWMQSGMVGVASIFLFAALHSVVIKIGVVTQNLVVATKIALLAGFVCFSFANFPSGWEGMQVETAPQAFSIYTFASTLVWISLSFSGFNAAVYITSEVENPKRNVPAGLLLGTLLVSGFYVLLNFVFLYGAAPEQIKLVEDVAAVAANAIGGQYLALLIRVVVCVALLSSVSSMVIAGPRVYSKMAEDGLFPEFLSNKNLKSGDVSAAAVWLQAILACVVVCFFSLNSLLNQLSFTLSVSAAITVACMFWTKKENSDSPLVNFLFSAIAGVYVIATIGLAVLSASQRPWQLAGFAFAVVSGLLLYGLVANREKIGEGKDSND